MKNLTIISFFVLILAATAFSQTSNIKCPFQTIYNVGDGVTDIGNSIRIPPLGPRLPAACYPYGTTFPGHPTGRWSDGLISNDYAGTINNIYTYNKHYRFVFFLSKLKFDNHGAKIMQLKVLAYGILKRTCRRLRLPSITT